MIFFFFVVGPSRAADKESFRGLVEDNFSFTQQKHVVTPH